MNPLTVRIFVAWYYKVLMSSVATAKAIFSKMEAALTKHDISWVNCVGISLDNTSVNMGCHNSIKTRVQHANLAIYIMGCPCHIVVHNIAGKADNAFEKVISYKQLAS